MSKSSKVLWVAWVLLLIAWIVCFINRERNHETRTEMKILVDTIKFYKFVPSAEKSLGSITAKLPISVPKIPEIRLNLPKTVPKSRDSVENFGKSTEKLQASYRQVSDKTDSVEVDIPITQKVYSDDSTYTAYVSGFNQQLDSLIFHRKREVVTVTKWKPPKRWSIGIQAGYGMSRNGMQPYIGIGVSYNLFSF